MKYRRQAWKHGESMDIFVFPVKEKSPGRGKKRKPTRACQERLNKIHKADDLKRKLGLNFREGDIYFTATYTDDDQPESYERAYKDAKNFLARVMRARRKTGIEESFKWVFVTEQGSVSGRWHHHFIFTGGLPWEQVAKIWGKGKKSIDGLYYDEAGSFKGIAYYFCKVEEKNKKASDDDDEIGSGGRLHTSRNLIKPNCTENDFEISRRKASRIAKSVIDDDISDIIGITKGYRIVEAANFFNEIDGCYYLKIYLRKAKEKKKGRRSP